MPERSIALGDALAVTAAIHVVGATPRLRSVFALAVTTRTLIIVARAATVAGAATRTDVDPNTAGTNVDALCNPLSADSR